MSDREKVIKEKLDEMVELTRGLSYASFMTAVENATDILALLKEQEKPNGKCVNECECWDAAYERGKQDALKEQEAVTIKKTKEHGFGVYGGICPKCRNWIQSAHSFCGFCGQAVKWE